jgi:hypothetical protein
MVVGTSSAWNVQEVTAKYSDDPAKFKDLISQIKFHQTQSWLRRNGATPPGNPGQMPIGKQITSSRSPQIPKQISNSTGRTNHVITTNFEANQR